MRLITFVFVLAISLAGCDSSSGDGVGGGAADAATGSSGSGSAGAAGTDAGSSGDDTSTGSTSTTGDTAETCTATFRWLQKDAYAEVAGRSSPLWPPHTTTTYHVTCADGVAATTFMANHGTEPGALDANGDELLVEVAVAHVNGPRDELLALYDEYQLCECGSATEFLSMDALEDQAVQLVVGRILNYVGAYLDCGGAPPVEDVIQWLQDGDIESVLGALPGCTWEDGHDWATGFSDAGLALLDDVVTTLDGYHVCNNDAVLQTGLWEAYAATGTVGSCDATGDVCKGPLWLYTPTVAEPR